MNGPIKKQLGIPEKVIWGGEYVKNLNELVGCSRIVLYLHNSGTVHQAYSHVYIYDPFGTWIAEVLVLFMLMINKVILTVCLTSYCRMCAKKNPLPSKKLIFKHSTGLCVDHIDLCTWQKVFAHRNTE